MELIRQSWGVDGKIHSLKKGLQIQGKADIINELRKICYIVNVVFLTGM